jgi:RNA polymerase sigma-70 factor (family 1)
MQETATESVWIRGLKNGNRLYFNQVFLKYNKKVYGLARKLHLSHEDSQEIVQEVFLTIWRSRENINLSLSFNAYVFKISQSYIIKFFRKQANHKAYHEYSLANCINQDQIISDWESEDLSKLINHYIEKLPDQRKKVFILSRQQNLSYQEISCKLNISVRTVESHIFKALKFLKNKLSTEEIAY